MTQLAASEESIMALLSWQSYVHTSYSGLLTSKTLEKMTTKHFDLSPVSIKTTWTDTILGEDDIDEVKTPLRVDQFRHRVRQLMLRSPIDTHKALRSLL